MRKTVSLWKDIQTKKYFMMKSSMLFMAAFMLVASMSWMSGMAGAEDITAQIAARAAQATTKAKVGGTGGIATTESADATALAQSLIGSGIAVGNATMTCSLGAAGGFSNAGSVFGIDTGVILSSGHISHVTGPNSSDSITKGWGTAGDADLNALSGKNTYDACILEFDFVPTAATVSFSYVFASDEYNEYVNSSFNDAFGFFINGSNCALVNGAPVTISTINNGNPYGSGGPNSDVFVNNDLSDGGPFYDTEMDGFTKPLTCAAFVTPGVTNHIKLAIADASDTVYDSNVMIGGGTMQSVNYNFELTVMPAYQEGNPGADLNFQVEIKNIGGTTDSYTIGFADCPPMSNGPWPASLSTNYLGNVEPLSSGVLTLTKSIPLGAENSAEDFACVHVASVGDPTKQAHYSVIVTAKGVANAVAIDPPEQSIVGGAGSTVEYSQWIVNNGTQSDAFNLYVCGSPDLNVSGNSCAVSAAWPTHIKKCVSMYFYTYCYDITDIGPMDPFWWEGLNVTLDIPASTPNGGYNVSYLIAQSKTNSQITAVETLTTSVVNALKDLTLSPTNDNKEGEPGNIVSYLLTLKNTGSDYDSFNISWVPSGWDIPDLSQSTSVYGGYVTLAAGEEMQFTVEVVIPADAVPGTAENVVVTYTSVGDITKSATSTLHTGVKAPEVIPAGFGLEPQYASLGNNSGASVTYSLVITNIGEATDTYALSLVAGNNWTTTLQTDSITVSGGDSVSFDVTVNIPKTALMNDNDTAAVLVTSASDSTKTATAVLLTVAFGKECKFIREMPSYYIPGIPFTVRIHAVPTCITDLDPFWAAEENYVPAGWAVSNLSQNGAFYNGKITFDQLTTEGIDTGASEQILTYDLTPTAGSGTVTLPFGETGGQGGISGTLYPFVGDKTIAENSGYHPADTGLDWKIGLAEYTAYGAAWKKGKTWPSWNPVTIGFVVNAAYIWKHNVGYNFDATETTAPACWVAPGKAPRRLGTSTASRVFSPASYTAGQPVTVNITVTPDAGTTAYAVEDAPPSGWVVSNITPKTCSYDSTNKKVNCGPYADATTRTFSYAVTPPAGQTGGKTFIGTASFDGIDTVIANSTLSDGFALTVTVSGISGAYGFVTSDTGGISCGATCAATYALGTVVTLTATPEGTARFAGWSGGGCSGTGTCKVTISQATTVKANFVTAKAKKLTLKVVSAHGKVIGTGIACGGTTKAEKDCSEIFYAGVDEVVVLTASPAKGYKLSKWTGCDSKATAAECTVTMKKDKTVTAVYAKLKEYKLTVVATPKTGGQVTSDPTGVVCGGGKNKCTSSIFEGDTNNVVTLVATPKTPYTKVSWSKGCTVDPADATKCSVTLKKNVTVTATFKKK